MRKNASIPLARKVRFFAVLFSAILFVSLFSLPGMAEEVEADVGIAPFSQVIEESRAERFFEGAFQDLSFEMPYIWIEEKEKGMQKISWLYGSTVFVSFLGEEVTPRVFLETYKGERILVGVRSGEESAAFVMQIDR
jgi:hypothetical protein